MSCWLWNVFDGALISHCHRSCSFVNAFDNASLSVLSDGNFYRTGYIEMAVDQRKIITKKKNHLLHTYMLYNEAIRN